MYQKSDSACSLPLLVKEIQKMRDILPSLKGEEEKSLLQEISGVLKSLVTIAKNSEDFNNSIGETIKNISTTLEKTDSNLTQLRSETIEKFFSSLSPVLEQVNNNFKQVEKCYQEMTKFFLELKRRTEEELTKRKLEEAREHNDKGVALFYMGNGEAAKTEFTKAIEFDPELAEAYNNLALTLSELDLNDEAVENFKKAYTLKPDLFEAYSNLALIHFKKGDLEEAIELLEEAAKKSHSNSIAHLNLGNGFLQLGRFEDALHAWERALEIDPSNENARERIVLYKEGKLDGYNRKDQTEG